LFAGLALITTTFLWQRMNDAGPLDTSRAQKWFEPLAGHPRLNPNTGEQALQPPAPKTLTDGEAIAERRRTERILGQPPPPEAVPEGVPQETSAHAELPASDGVKRLTETVPNEHVPITLEQGQEAKSSPASGSSALVSIESLAVPSEHAVIPDLPGAAPIPDPQVPLATEQPAEALAVNTHSASAPQSMVSGLPAEAAIKDQPAEALAVNTPEQHFDASSPNYTTLPPVTTAPPSVDVTELPSDAELIPRPARKPLIQKPVTKPVIQKPVTKPVIQKSVTKPVNQRTEVDRAKGQSFFDKKVRSSIADLLVGGL
jgi:hypothetical protein